MAVFTIVNIRQPVQQAKRVSGRSYEDEKENGEKRVVTPKCYVEMGE